jgi:predicted permease
MFQDLRFGLKLLWKERAFSLTALLTLALCIGANTAIFTVFSAVILEPLPIPEPGRVATMYNIYPGVGVDRYGANGVPDYLDRRKMTDVFEAVTLFGNSGYDVGAQSSPQRLEGQYVTPEYFRILGAQPVLGRTFTADEAVLGKDKVAVLSYGLWKDMFGRDPGVLGRDIRMSGQMYRIVGVMPESMYLTSQDARIWVPFAFQPRQTTDDARHSNSWAMLARLKPGVSVAQARQRIDALNKLNLERFPKYRKLLEDARFSTRVVALKDEIIRDIRPTLYLLQAAVALVLLIGCVNVANLMLVRSNIRMKELAVRHSLGASRARIARQLLTESVALAMIGGLLGIVVGIGGVRLLTWLGARDLPRAADMHISGPVLLFSTAIAALTGLIFGSVPVYHLFRRNLIDVFRQTGRTGTAERGAMWTRSALVVCQVSLAFVLLIGSGLLTLSFSRVLSVKPGFNPENVVSAQFSLRQERYREGDRARGFIDRALEGVRAIPGIKAAGATSYLPFSGENNANAITIEGYTLAPGEALPVPAWSFVDSGYFRTMGIPVLRGRGLSESDAAGAQQVCIIDQFLARKYWPKGDMIGAKIRDGVDQDTSLWTVVGVVGNVKMGDLAESNPVGHMYFHYKQKVPRGMWVVVKTGRDDPQVASAIRREILRADPELPIFDVKSMPQRVSSSLLNRRAAMILCLIFGGLALLLSAIGIYGVLAYTVTQRTREFGIRAALGAASGDVLGMVVGQGLKLAGAGLLIGVAAALALTRLMTSLLYDVKPTDPGVFVAVGVALAAVALVASVIPSLRAIRVRPAVALRYE